MGPCEGAPVNYFWNPIYSVSGLLPWAFVAAGFVFFKENQNKSAFLILAPVFIAFALWMIYCRTVTILPAEKSQYDIVFSSLIAGFTLFCLLSSRLSKIHGPLTLICLIVLVGLIYTLHLRINLGFNSALLEWGIMYFVIALLTVIPSFLAAGSFCRMKYRFLRFMSFYTAGLAVFAAISHLLVISIYCLLWKYSLGTVLSRFPVLWLETVLLCLSISIPYLVVIFTSDFWRGRFENLFGIQTRLAGRPVEQVEETLPVTE